LRQTEIFSPNIEVQVKVVPAGGMHWVARQ